MIAEWADLKEGATVVEERGRGVDLGGGERHETRISWRSGVSQFRVSGVGWCVI